MIKILKILCPVDFSDASKKSIRYAHEFARGMGASLYLLNVVEPRPMAVDMSLSYVPLEEDLEKAAREDLELIVAAEREKGIVVEADVEIGTPSEIILEKAAELDVNLIILGSHGKTGLSRLLMGSVAESVVRKAQCPVLIVKAEETDFIE
ncbi:MAG: universal stress protein [Prosthecochloris sp.]|uniref:Universal stress protein n=1 Tax=Prosthecochloris aestuarii (strain DSM 271 / SK 413) TaxID=290512 RepID=B4S781_PROA2|nr:MULTISPECIES: universal stress protein [Prosthecochloris]ACF45918.1 UspA domain protein [Prosthecochloris aestuarii DSM 271]MCW8798619.1 universal stress protein [Prosthecochloris sp.]NEX11363.1 universal stress protein [Prosthecochloris sp.]RDD30574.1 universal stress protein [Prosthecochloris sp. ZM]